MVGTARQVQIMAARKAADARLRERYPEEWDGLYQSERVARGLPNERDEKIAALKAQLRALGVEVE